MKIKKRILVITSIFPNSEEIIKGIYIYRQVKAIAKYAEVLVIAPIPYFPKWLEMSKYSHYTKIPSNSNLDGIKIMHPRIITIPKTARFLYGVLYFFSIIKIFTEIIKNFNPDFCLSYWAYPDGFASVALSKITKKPIAISCRGSDINELKEKSLKWKMTKWALMKSGRVFAVSKAMKSTIESMGVNFQKIVTVPNGVDINRFKIIEKKIYQKKSGLNKCDNNSKKILFCGRYSPEKGPDVLLESFKTIRELGYNCKLFFVGEGSMEELLKLKVNKYNLQKHVTFLGVKSHNEIPYIMNACDVLCLPSLFEGWPNALMEALACGLPIVASNVGGVSEIITSEQYGILVPPNDAQLLAEALIKSTKKKWDRKLLNKKFGKRSWDVVAKEILNNINF